MPSVGEIRESLRNSPVAGELMQTVEPLLPLLAQAGIPALDGMVQDLLRDDIGSALESLAGEAHLRAQQPPERLRAIQALGALQGAAWNAPVMLELLVKLLVVLSAQSGDINEVTEYDFS